MSAQSELIGALNKLEESDGWLIVKAWLMDRKRVSELKRLRFTPPTADSANLYMLEQMVAKAREDEIVDILGLPEQMISAIQENAETTGKLLIAIREMRSESQG